MSAEDIAKKFWRALAAAMPKAVRDRIRASYAERFGTCQRCGEPLDGPSPSKICTDCHADAVLDRAGGGKGGDA